MAQAKDIKEKVLWVIQSQENQKQGGGTDLRIIQWVIDGKPSRAMLEKRDWYLDENGDRKIGKAKGMVAGDLYLIITNLKAIAKLLEVKPEHLAEAMDLAMFKDDKPTSSAAQGSAPQSVTTSKPEPAMAAASNGSPPDIDF